MKTYPKSCHRLLILSNWWASEKSTSRYRNRWKAIQNCVIDYSFWVIAEHPKNRRLGVAMDENLFKIWAIESFDAPEIVGASFWGSENGARSEKTSKIKENACFIFASFGDREIHPRHFYAVELKRLHVYFFYSEPQNEAPTSVQPKLCSKIQISIYESKITIQKKRSFLKILSTKWRRTWDAFGFRTFKVGRTLVGW